MVLPVPECPAITRNGQRERMFLKCAKNINASGYLLHGWIPPRKHVWVASSAWRMNTVLFLRQQRRMLCKLPPTLVMIFMYSWSMYFLSLRAIKQEKRHSPHRSSCKHWGSNGFMANEEATGSHNRLCAHPRMAQYEGFGLWCVSAKDHHERRRAHSAIIA